MVISQYPQSLPKWWDECLMGEFKMRLTTPQYTSSSFSLRVFGFVGRGLGYSPKVPLGILVPLEQVTVVSGSWAASVVSPAAQVRGQMGDTRGSFSAAVVGQVGPVLKGSPQRFISPRDWGKCLPPTSRMPHFSIYSEGWYPKTWR